MENIITVGDIINDPKGEKRYRVVGISQHYAVLCQMDIPNLRLIEYDISTLLELKLGHEITIEHEDAIIFNRESLPERLRARYDVTKGIVNEVMNLYHNRLVELPRKTTKPELAEILKRNSFPKSSFWRIITKYLQSGMNDYALADTRGFGLNKGREYNHTKKPGSKSQYFKSVGVLVTDEIKDYFDEAIKEYRSGRQKTLKSCYDRMNLLHFVRTEIVNGSPAVVLLPESERPTIRQFYYYANKKLTKQEKDAIKTSIQEQRNNKRLITSDSLNGVYGPGDLVEIDACEADVSLVSTLDPNQSIGRPIVYFMVDVFTRIILAVSVAFDNNSILGVTNLFLNLADDKQAYCNKFGIGFDNPMMWPSNIIPRRVRVDRGAEFKSNEFDRICNALGIEKQIVPGASGSLKGVVEQSFHQMHVKQNPHLEDYGLIEKRYDSNHHKEATLNIEQYTKMVINFVLTHNQEYDSNYPVSKEMIEQNVKPIPCLLWKYGVEKYGNPKPIPVRNQYLFYLMTPIHAKLDRRGISYKQLYYLPEGDIALSREMFDAGTKKVPFEARMDMRDIGHIYYLRDGKLIDAPLNPNLSGNADFSGLTMKQYEDYLQRKGRMRVEGKVHNQELAAFNYSVNAAVVAEAKKEFLSDSKHMRPARELEKQTVSHEGSITSRIETVSELPEKQQETIEQDTKKRKKYQNFEEALDDFWENN